MPTHHQLLGADCTPLPIAAQLLEKGGGGSGLKRRKVFPQGFQVGPAGTGPLPLQRFHQESPPPCLLIVVHLVVFFAATTLALPRIFSLPRLPSFPSSSPQLHSSSPSHPPSPCLPLPLSLIPPPSSPSLSLILTHALLGTVSDDPVLEESIGLRAHGRMVFRTIGQICGCMVHCLNTPWQRQDVPPRHGSSFKNGLLQLSFSVHAPLQGQTTWLNTALCIAPTRSQGGLWRLEMTCRRSCPSLNQWGGRTQSTT